MSTKTCDFSPNRMPISVLLLLFACVIPVPAAPVTSVVLLASSPNPIVQGQTETFAVSINATAATFPSGTVTLLDTCVGTTTSTPVTLGSVILGSPTSASPGAGGLTVTTFPCLGGNSITAVYSGDVHYSSGQSAPLLITVLDQFTPVAVTLASSLNPSAAGQSVTFSVTLAYTDTQNTEATGTVSFKDTNTGAVLGTSNVLTVSRQTAPAALFTTSSLAAGSYAIQATYSGDTLYAPAASQILNQVVQQAAIDPTSTSLTASATSLAFGSPVALNAQVTSPAGTPSGTVSFYDSAALLGSMSLDVNGQATLTTSSLAVGTHSISATYGGSGTFATSNSGTASVTVQSPPLASTTTVLSASSNPAAAGSSTTLSAVVTSSGSGIPTGTVTFQDAVSGVATVLGTISVQNGIAAISSSFLAGTHQLSATYSGDTNFSGSQGSLTEVVNLPVLPPTATAITSSSNPSVFGQAVTFTASVSGSAGIPTGAITFSVGAANAIVTLDSTGTAVFTTSTIPTGTAGVSAVYSGDNANAGSASPSLVQTVSAASTSTTVVSSLNPSTQNASLTFTATVTVNAPGSGTPTGAVSFVADGSNVLCSGMSLQSDGTASCISGALAAGPHTVVATYNGDSNFLLSTNAITQTVNATPNNSGLSLQSSGFVYSRVTKLFSATMTIASNGPQAAPGGIQIVFNNLPAGVTLQNADGMVAGAPYILFPGALNPGQSASFPVFFADPTLTEISYAATFNTGLATAAKDVSNVRQVRRFPRRKAER